MVLYKHIFYESDPRRDHQQIVLFIHFVAHALALHLAVKYYFKSFCVKDLGTLALHASVSLYFPPECQQDRTLLRNQYY